VFYQSGFIVVSFQPAQKLNGVPRQSVEAGCYGALKMRQKAENFNGCI